MTLKGGTSQACASCKYQRRKCTSRCPLAPYFPADQPKVFENVHKLFGVKKIQNILKNLDPSQHHAAMQSIIYHANIRDHYPVTGCLGVIRSLQSEILALQQEFQIVRSQIELCRQQQQNQQQLSTLNLDQDFPSQLELGMAPPTNGVSLVNHSNNSQLYNNNSATTELVSALPVATQEQSLPYMDSKYNHQDNSIWVQNPFPNNCNSNAKAQQPQFVVPAQTLSIQEGVDDYDEMHQLFEAIDDRQSFIDSKKPYESCFEESLKDTTQSMEHVGENELKNAAAFFSLTSV